MALVDIRTKVIGIVSDDSGKLANPADFDRNINLAITHFSRHKPNIKVVDIVGNATSDYALPTGWEADFSAIKSIEIPIGDVPATLLENDEYEIYSTPTGDKVRLKFAKPSATQSFRIVFTIKRTYLTISGVDEDNLSLLASAYCLEELSNIFTQTSDSTIAADAVNYRSKSAEFAARAKSLKALYKERMGIKDDDVAPPVSAVTDFDIGYPGGRDRLTHPRWQRKGR